MRELFGIVVILFGQSAAAFVGSVSAATGETGRGSIEASDSPFMNPAAVAHLAGYYFTLGYAGGGNSQAINSDLAISVTDNMRDTVVPTSFAFVQRTEDLSGGLRNTQKDFRISLANFLNTQFAMGLGVLHRQSFLVTGQSSETDMDLGGLWAPNKDFGVGAMAGNVFARGSDIPEGRRLQKYYALATSYHYKQFMRLKADLVIPERGKVNFGLGLENYINKWIVLRLGHQINGQGNYKLHTGGLGFIGPAFGLHYAYQMSPDSPTLERHSIDLAIPVW